MDTHLQEKVSNRASAQQRRPDLGGVTAAGSSGDPWLQTEEAMLGSSESELPLWLLDQSTSHPGRPRLGHVVATDDPRGSTPASNNLITCSCS